jgi:hypothetical protein
MGYRIRIPGVGGKIEDRAARLRAAVAAEFARLEEERKPKPSPALKTFAHIRDYRSVSN